MIGKSLNCYSGIFYVLRSIHWGDHHVLCIIQTRQVVDIFLIYALVFDNNCKIVYYDIVKKK